LCSSEEEARTASKNISTETPYPVYFFDTDTSGEKLYEEFYTATDKLDMETFTSLGVVKNAKKLPKQQIEETIQELETLMNSGQHNKQSIVDLMKKHLPDFEHIETGKTLDQKM
jgi:FlaA1/EpsC-like NDP-sugar epimerase